MFIKIKLTVSERRTFLRQAVLVVVASKRRYPADLQKQSLTVSLVARKLKERSYTPRDFMLLFLFSAVTPVILSILDME